MCFVRPSSLVAPTLSSTFICLFSCALKLFDRWDSKHLACIYQVKTNRQINLAKPSHLLINPYVYMRVRTNLTQEVRVVTTKRDLTCCVKLPLVILVEFGAPSRRAFGVKFANSRKFILYRKVTYKITVGKLRLKTCVKSVYGVEKSENS